MHIETLPDTKLTPMHKIGKIFGMNVYVDPYMTWEDTRILLGRKTKPDESGLIFVYDAKDMPVKELHNSTSLLAKTSYTGKYKIHPNGKNSHCNYLIMNLNIEDE